MYKVLKDYLETASYTITDAKNRIDYAVVRGRITTEEANELSSIAENRGTTEELTPKSLDERVTELESAVMDLASMIADFVGGDAEDELISESEEEAYD